MPEGGRRGAAVAVAAGVAGVVLFVAYFLWWWSLPYWMWQVGLGFALVAVVVGLVSSRRARVGGLLGAALGAVVLAYFVLLIYTLGSD